VTLNDALYHLVHDYPGGAAALSARCLHLAPSTLQSMANPNDDGHGWPLRRFVEVMALSGDTRPIDALCAQFGGVFIKTAPMDAVGDRDLYELATKLTGEFGDVINSLRSALDGSGDAGKAITPREFAAFDTQIYEMQSAAAELRERVSRRVERRPIPVRAVK
jgi:hypothetical protein